MKRTCEFGVSESMFSPKRFVIPPLPRQTFVTLLGAHLARGEEHGNTWTADGTSFKVVNADAMAADVSLRSHVAKFTSVVRQLNLHGFRCVKNALTVDCNMYSHPLFHRDHPDKWCQIQRRVKPCTSPTPSSVGSVPGSFILDADMLTPSPLDSILEEDVDSMTPMAATPFDFLLDDDNAPSPVPFEPVMSRADPMQHFMTSVLEKLQAMENRLAALEARSSC